MELGPAMFGHWKMFWWCAQHTCWRETAGALTFFFEPQAGAFSKFFEFMTKSTMAKIFHLASHLSRVTPPNKMRKAFACFAVVESPTNTLSYKPKKE